MTIRSGIWTWGRRINEICDTEPPAFHDLHKSITLKTFKLLTHFFHCLASDFKKAMRYWDPRSGMVTLLPCDPLWEAFRGCSPGYLSPAMRCSEPNSTTATWQRLSETHAFVDLQHILLASCWCCWGDPTMHSHCALSFRPRIMRDDDFVRNNAWLKRMRKQ